MRKRRTNEQIATLESQIYAVLEADHPQSVRHVFYRMTDPRLDEHVDKTEAGYKQVAQRCTMLRRSGVLPYGWISDSTRAGYHVSTFDSATDFIDRMKHLYRADIWADLGVHVEVWCESRSIAGVIRSECKTLGVSLFPCGGFSSLSFVYEAADEINQYHADAPVHVLYIGDFDPAGVLIDRSLKTEFARHGVYPMFHRLAINEEQIARYGLPTKPRKETETRRPDILATVEAEAMPAATLRDLVVRKIESFIPVGTRDVVKIAEESERQKLAMFATNGY